MATLYRTIVRPIVTEKTSIARQERGEYVFEVAPDASKPAIRQAIEQLFGVKVTGVWTSMSNIGDLEEGNAAIREALTAIAKNRDVYLEAKARNSVQEARIGEAPPQLAGDLEAAARAENIQIAESAERPTVPAGRRYVEHDTDLKIRATDLQSLTNFMRRVETGPRLIFFTRLAIKHPYGADPDKLDVEATATAFEKVHEDKTKKKAGAPEKKE